MRYILDRGHPSQLPCGGRGLSWGLGLVFAVASKYLISLSRPWVFGNPEGITKECGRMGSRPYGFPSSVISMACFRRCGSGFEVAGIPVLLALRHQSLKTRDSPRRPEQPSTPGNGMRENLTTFTLTFCH